LGASSRTSFHEEISFFLLFFRPTFSRLLSLTLHLCNYGPPRSSFASFRGVLQKEPLRRLNHPAFTVFLSRFLLFFYCCCVSSLLQYVIVMILAFFLSKLCFPFFPVQNVAWTICHLSDSTPIAGEDLPWNLISPLPPGIFPPSPSQLSVFPVNLNFFFPTLFPPPFQRFDASPWNEGKHIAEPCQNPPQPYQPTPHRLPVQLISKNEFIFLTHPFRRRRRPSTFLSPTPPNDIN